MITMITGDDVNFAVTLTKADSTFNIATTAAVTAVIREDDVALSSTENCFSATPGANWSQSLVVAHFPKSVTNRLPTTKQAVLEIQVTDGSGTTTWLVKGIEIKKGLLP